MAQARARNNCNPHLTNVRDSSCTVLCPAARQVWTEGSTLPCPEVQRAASRPLEGGRGCGAFFSQGYCSILLTRQSVNAAWLLLEPVAGGNYCPAGCCDSPPLPELCTRLCQQAYSRRLSEGSRADTRISPVTL